MIKRFKEHIGFHYLLREIQLYYLIRLELNISLNKIKDKSGIHNIFSIQDKNSIMCGFDCIALVEYMLQYTLLHYTNSFSPNDYKTNEKIYIYISIAEIIMLSLAFRLKK